MLLLLTALGMLGFLIWGSITEKYDKGNWIIGIISIGFLFLFIGIPWSISNATSVKKLEAFYDASITNYRVTAEKTVAFLSADDIQFDSGSLVNGSIEKFKVTDIASQRLAEYRDEVNKFNNDLASYRVLDKNLWVGSIYPTPREDLKYIAIK